MAVPIDAWGNYHASTGFIWTAGRHRSAASAQAIQRVEIAEPGIYRAAGKLSTRNEPGTTGGTFTMLNSPGLVEATTTIPATVGVMFGFRYNAFGTTVAPVTLKFVTLLPEPGIRDPKTGTTRIRGEYLERVTVGGLGEFKGYSFDQSWEIVTGTWTFEIWEGDRKLASQSFNVIAPF
jgi:hypothetical protein